MPLTIEQKKAIDTTAHVWVSASAGTGKTKILVDRIVRLLMEGVPPHHILCLTFTNAAASEMQERLHKRLAEWVSVDEQELRADLADVMDRADVPPELLSAARNAWFALVHHPQIIMVQTIHGFCQSLLAQFPLEAGLSPGFVMMEEDESKALMLQAAEAWLNAADRQTMSMVAQFTDSMHEMSFSKWLGELLHEQEKLRRLYAGGDEAIMAHHARVAGMLGVRPTDEPSSHIERYASERPPYVESLYEWVKLKADARMIFRTFWDAPLSEKPALWDDYATLFLKTDGGFRSSRDLYRKADVAMNPEWEEQIKREQQRFFEAHQLVLAQIRYSETVALHEVMHAMLVRYAQEKQNRHVIDYSDVLLYAQALLSDVEQRAWVHFKLDSMIEHVLVDEAQDTSPLQWDVVSQLTEEFFSGFGQHNKPPSLFVVGDQKQSIYRFQGAEPESFQRYYQHFSMLAQQSNMPFHTVQLTQSFRSVPTVLGVVDAAFAPKPLRQSLQHGEPSPVHHDAFKQGQAGEVLLMPLIKYQKPAEPPVELAHDYMLDISGNEQHSDALARTIARWLNEGYWLEAKQRFACAGDMLILLRTRGHMMQPLMSALRKHHVPVAGADKLNVISHLAAQDIFALARWALDMADNYALACILKSPLAGVGEEELYALAVGRGDVSLWDALQQSPQHAALCERLRYWVQNAQELSADAWLLDVLHGQHATMRDFLRRFGHEVAEPLDELLLMVEQAAKQSSGTVSDVMMALEQQTHDIKRSSERSNEVRVMTVHGAKGLQSPIVWMPEMFSAASKPSPLLWCKHESGCELALAAGNKESRPDSMSNILDIKKQEDDAEALRLLYVGLTRAEDTLCMSAAQPSKNVNTTHWYDVMAAAMQAQQAAIVQWPEWEGEVLSVSTKSEHPCKADTESTISKTIAMPAWWEDALLDNNAGERPVEEAPSYHEGNAIMNEASLLAVVRGTAMHELLQTLPTMDASQHEAFAMRWLGAALPSMDDAYEAWQKIQHVMQVKEFKDIFSSKAQRELPVAGMAGGHYRRGVIDCLVEYDDHIWVIDYKTDHATGDNNPLLQDYISQLNAYKSLIINSFADKELRCSILWVENATLMHLDDVADATYIQEYKHA